MIKIEKTSITKTEKMLIIECLSRIIQKDITQIEQHKKIKIQKIINKFKKLSPYYEYKLDPIMYDEY